MKIEELRLKPLWQMTGEEFLFLQEQSNVKQLEASVESNTTEKKYVYGYAGLARLFNCSIPTAARIKASGKIDKAITQIGRKIIINVELALELGSKKNGGRGSYAK